MIGTQIGSVKQLIERKKIRRLFGVRLADKVNLPFLASSELKYEGFKSLLSRCVWPGKIETCSQTQLKPISSYFGTSFWYLSTYQATVLTIPVSSVSSASHPRSLSSFVASMA